MLCTTTECMVYSEQVVWWWCCTALGRDSTPMKRTVYVERTMYGSKRLGTGKDPCWRSGKTARRKALHTLPLSFIDIDNPRLRGLWEINPEDAVEGLIVEFSLYIQSRSHNYYTYLWSCKSNAFNKSSILRGFAYVFTSLPSPTV